MNKILRNIKARKKKLDKTLEKYEFDYFITDKGYLNLIKYNKKLGGLYKKSLEQTGGEQPVQSNNKKQVNEGNIKLKICKLSNIVKSMKNIMTNINGLQIMGLDKKIGDMTDMDLMKYISSISNVGKGVKFDRYNSKQMETMYKSYYSLTQNLLLSIAFQRNFLSSYELIIEIVNDIDSYINQVKNTELKAQIVSIKQSVENINNIVKTLVMDKKGHSTVRNPSPTQLQNLQKNLEKVHSELTTPN